MSMVEFYYNYSTNEAITHSLFEVMHGYQPCNPTNCLLPMVGAMAYAVDKLTLIADI